MFWVIGSLLKSSSEKDFATCKEKDKRKNIYEKKKWMKEGKIRNLFWLKMSVYDSCQQTFIRRLDQLKEKIFIQATTKIHFHFYILLKW